MLMEDLVAQAQIRQTLIDVIHGYGKIRQVLQYIGNPDAGVQGRKVVDAMNPGPRVLVPSLSSTFSNF
jgi:hypothetical protein